MGKNAELPEAIISGNDKKKRPAVTPVLLGALRPSDGWGTVNYSSMSIDVKRPCRSISFSSSDKTFAR
jgi:hypothetical protein